MPDRGADGPELSVVIPTRDTRELTLRCLGSLGALAGAGGVEVLVVDDGSRDGTAEAVAERFPGVEVLRSDRSRGFTASANCGLARAGGRIVLLLNSDTELAPGWEAVVRGAFARDPGLGIAGAQLFYPDGRPQWSGGRAPTLPWLFALASGGARWLRLVPGWRRLRSRGGGACRRVDWVTGAALAVRREVVEAVGPLDEAFAFYGQDLDFCLRARRCGYRVGIVPELRVVHHHGATIARGAGAVGPQQPELLWRDLVRWARKHRGPLWAARAARALAWGARARLAGRALLAPLRRAPERESWRRDTLAYRRALTTLRRPVPEI